MAGDTRRPPESLDVALPKAAQLLKSSKRTVAFTGAGISVESGIPDFRSPGGLWSKYDPSVYCSYPVFQQQPQLFWAMARAMVAEIGDARPNAAHVALARLQRLGLVASVLTQNVDGLHQAAGSPNVVELHGGIASTTCTACRDRRSSEEARRQLEEGAPVPLCPVCSAPLKLDVVLFGERLAEEALGATAAAAASADVILVVGTSLAVAPANSLVALCRRRGGKVIGVDPAASALLQADVGLCGKAGEVLPQLLAAVTRL